MEKILEDMAKKPMDIGRDVIPYLTANNYPVYGWTCEG
jgi:hypothetical protein